jgi:hypothetical protein
MLRRVVDGGARDAELSEELRAFVEHDAESKIRSGMTPDDARRAALIELGGSAALLAAAMLLASILPARRAARLDPNAVLRQE